MVVGMRQTANGRAVVTSDKWRVTSGAKAFAEVVLAWLRDPDEARRKGKLARQAVEDFNQRSRKELNEVMSDPPSRGLVASFAPLMSPCGLPLAGSPARPSAPVVGATGE